MNIHFPSIGFASFVFSILSALLMIIVRKINKSVPGTGLWTLAAVVNAVMWTLVIAIRSDNWEMANLLQGSLVPFRDLLILEGVILFRGIGNFSKLRYYQVIAAVIVLFTPLVILDMELASFLFRDFILFIIRAGIASILLFRARKREFWIHGLTAVPAFVLAIGSLVRFLVVLSGDPLWSNPEHPVMIVLFFISFIWNMEWIFGLTMAVNLRVRNELSELNRLKDRLFQVISHDLRVPINNFRNLLTVINNNSAKIPEEEKKKYYQALDLNIDSADMLMENLLALGNKYSETSGCKKEIASMHALINEAVGFVKAEADRKGVVLDLKENEDITVFIDPHMISAVIRNLLANAIKFTHAAGTVSVGFSILADTVEVEVADNGIGISEEILGTIRDGAAEFSSYGTEGESGTGIGLMVCRYFLDKHGSRLSICSAPGEGTIVTFHLERYKK